MSLRGPRDGGVVCTRMLRGPGGKLLLNAAAKEGQITERVSGPDRKVRAGFDHGDCVAFRGDATAAVKWQGRSLNELRGQPIRLEFFIQGCDLYSFRAAGK